MRRALRGFVAAGALATLLLVVPARAQEPADEAEAGEAVDPEEDRASAFRAVSGPEAEQVPGGTLLIAAYGVIWVLVLGWFWRLGRLQARTRDDLERLRASLDAERD